MTATAISSPTAVQRASELLNGEGLMRIKDVLTVYRVSPSTWYQGIREGRYPQGVKIGKRAKAWHSSKIRALLAYGVK